MQHLRHHLGTQNCEPRCRHSAQAAPASSQLGFFRFLQLLGTHPWAQQPLIVDPAQALSEADVKAAHATYRARKAAGPVPACYVITPYDRKSEVWSDGTPMLQVLGRASQLAASSLAALTGVLSEESFVSRCVIASLLAGRYGQAGQR